jgi:hypothetical protein
MNLVKCAPNKMAHISNNCLIEYCEISLQLLISFFIKTNLDHPVYQHSYCIALDCTALHCTALHCIALHCTALHCTALHCSALQCITLHCTALHCKTLHCTALHNVHMHTSKTEVLCVNNWTRKVFEQWFLKWFTKRFIHVHANTGCI